MKIGFVVGSLRKDSANRTLARAASELVPDGTAVLIEGLDLPNYSEELEGDVPAVAAEWRTTVESLDGIVFVTPEYNALPSGSVKNAIDWASRPYGEASLAGKPVAVLGASISPNGALWAQEAVLKAVPIGGGVAFDRDPVPVGPAPEKLGEDGILDAELEGRIRDYLGAFVDELEAVAV